MKLICAADLHLGRTPSRLPSRLGVPTSELTPAAAWRNLVAAAIREEADAVLLAGDVVEDRHDFFEAFADLQEGLASLIEAGIAVFAVSGNHDVEVLPRLADQLPGLRLLGRGGDWECLPFERGGRRVRLLGWSFPNEAVTASPLEGGVGDALRGTGAGPLIGLLHGDRDGPKGPYAPFRSWQLEEVGADAWLLGHVHVPDDLGAGAPIGYLGSLAAADPGEAGTRGAWRMTLDAGTIAVERMPLAPLRYETVEVPVGDLARGSETSHAILDALRRLHERLAPERDALRAVGCRLVFTGRTDLGDEVRRTLASEDPREAIQPFDGISYFVHAWRIDVRPRIDLAALADRRDPLAIVAKTLLILDGEDQRARRELLNDARPRLVAVQRSKAFALLGREEPSDEELAERLRVVSLRALDDLLAQRDGEARA